MAKTVSVIVPSRNELKNLLWTLQAVMADLEGLDFELIPVLNRCNPDDQEAVSRYWPFKTGHGQVVVYDEKASCWGARNAGAKVATGEYLLFLDSHVMPSPGSFRRLIEFHRGWKGIAHCALNYWLEPEARALYGYKWRPDKFWGDWTRTRPLAPDFHVPLSGTSSSLIDRATFDEVGGWHPEFGVYGGGEPYLDLLVQMYGYEVRLDPENRLWHLTEHRGYTWTNEEVRRNFMIAAFVLGGLPWLDRLYGNFREANKGVTRYNEALDEIRREVLQFCAPAFERVQREAKHSLEEVIATFPSMR
jgi:glycosyltransferase involved in cell wall biosynthesis